MNTNMTELYQLVTLLYQLEVACMEMEDAPDVQAIKKEARELAEKCLFHPDASVNVGAVMQMASHGFVLNKDDTTHVHFIKSWRADHILIDRI